MRIALCITDLDVGGAEQALVALATRLDRSRFTPTVYCLGPEPTHEEASCIPPLKAAGIPVHCLAARSVAAFPAVVWKLRRQFLHFQPDLVQTFLFHANIAGRIAARAAGVRNVVCGIRVAERRSRWHLELDRLTTRWVQRYVCVSHSVARFSTEQGGLAPEKLVVIPNGVDLDQFPAAQPAALADAGVPLGSRVVVFVGRLEPQKGLSWLLEVAPQWLDRAPGVHLVVVGRGPERPALERLALRRGVADRVHWLGWRRDVAEILAASDVLVLPSRWEGMPNVVLQAMASRMPVLAADVEGVRELLGENADPQTVAFGDTSGLVEKLARLLSDRRLAERLGRENRNRVEQTFSVQRMVAAYEALWESMATDRVQGLG